MKKQNELLEAALKYAEIGWKIFPCGPKSKRPLLSKKQGGNGVKDATTDKKQIREWWEMYPTANIGLACGSASGVFVIDVDLDEDKGVNGWETLRTLQTEDKEISETVRQDSPRGGAHYLYKTNNNPANKNNFMGERFGKSGIDIRCDGYYIMLAPSVHPNGKKYKWTSKHGPDQVKMAEFPEFMRPELAKGGIRAAAPWEQKRVKRPARTKNVDKNVLERASAYLRECESAIQGAGGHDKLLWAARSLVVGFELDDGTALSLLWNEFNPRCIPPWDQGSPADVKDFERKVKEARRTNNKPMGWLLDECGLRPGAFDEKMLTLGAEIADRLLAGCKPEGGDYPSEWDDVKGNKKYVTKGSISSMERPAFLNPKVTRPKGAWPDELLNPPGFVGALCQWINGTAGCYQPLLTLGASLCAAGALFGRKVRDSSNGRTNLYAMGVAHSSAGKDHPADCIEQLFTMAGASDLLGGSRVTSDSAIEVGLQTYPVQLYHWDEVGHMFSAIKAAGSGGASHLRTIVPCLMELYSSPHKLYIGKQRADDTARRIDQPHVCVWGLTSPDVLYQGLGRAELRDGWLGRVVTFISHDRPKYQIKEFQAPPKHLIEFVRQWFMRDIEPPQGMGDVDAACTCHQLVVSTDELALKVFSDFRDKCYSKMIKCDLRGDDTQYLWGKALQNARRIALIISAGESYNEPVITEKNAKYACELIRRNIKLFSESIKNNLADNQWEADKLKIVRICKRGGIVGVSKSEITRQTQGIRDKRIRDSYINDLVEAEVIDNLPNPKTGKTWYWIHPMGLEATANKEK